MALKKVRIILDNRDYLRRGVRTINEMSEEEIQAIEKQYGMPINRNPIPKVFAEKSGWTGFSFNGGSKKTTLRC